MWWPATSVALLAITEGVQEHATTKTLLLERKKARAAAMNMKIYTAFRMGQGGVARLRLTKQECFTHIRRAPAAATVCECSYQGNRDAGVS